MPKRNVNDEPKYDIAVIGSGTGGYIAAIRAAKLGKKVVLIEMNDLGGTCLNRGCIPTKVLLHSAEEFEKISKIRDGGIINVSNISLDYNGLMKKKETVINKLKSGIKSLVLGNGIDLYIGKAFIEDKNVITINGKEVYADKIIIATGSRPSSILVKGIELDGVINSDKALSLDKLPDSIVIIGGGVIGVEFASIFNSLGKKVVIIEALPNILNGMDEDVCNTITEILQKKGIEIHTNASIVEIKEGLKCVYEKDHITYETEGEIIITAVGRKPNIQNLGLEKLGINLENEFVCVDEYLETNIPGIYAVGDITGKMQLAHVASAQGIIAAHNTCGAHRKMKYNMIPSCIYCQPEIAAIGMTEKKAREEGYSVKIGLFPVASNGKSMIMDEVEGFSKIVTEEKTGEILGCHIIAPRATDLIGEIAVAMNSEATIEEVSKTIHPHPTVSEIIMEAAHDVEGLCCNKI